MKIYSRISSSIHRLRFVSPRRAFTAIVFIGILSSLYPAWGYIADLRQTWQRCCMLLLPPDQVVYEESWDAAEQLRKSSDYTGPLRLLFNGEWFPDPPKEYRAPAFYSPRFLADLGLVRRNRAVLFMHNRRPPRGKPTLVVVQIMIGSIGPEHDVLIDPSCCKFDGKSVVEVIDFRESIVLKMSKGKQLHIFAGQPDAADDSHFTIHFDRGEGDEVLEGWLRKGPKEGATQPVTQPVDSMFDMKLGHGKPPTKGQEQGREN